MDGRYGEIKMAMITITAVIATFFVSLRVNILILVNTNPMANDDITITMLMASTNSGVMANAPPTPKLLKNDKFELIFVSNEMDVFDTKTMMIGPMYTSNICIRNADIVDFFVVVTSDTNLVKCSRVNGVPPPVSASFPKINNTSLVIHDLSSMPAIPDSVAPDFNCE